MNPFAIVGIALGGIILIVGITMVACIPAFKAQAKRQRERELIKQEKLKQKLELKKLEIEAKRVNIEVERDKALRVFCRFCGSRQKSGDRHCSGCGGAL